MSRRVRFSAAGVVAAGVAARDVERRMVVVERGGGGEAVAGLGEGGA